MIFEIDLSLQEAQIDLKQSKAMDNILRAIILEHPDITERYDFTYNELIKHSEHSSRFDFLQIYIDPTQNTVALHVTDTDGEIGWMKYTYGLIDDDLEFEIRYD